MAVNSEAELQTWLRKKLPLYGFIGLTVDSWGETLQCSVPLSPENRNHFGGMHAAVQWALAETLGGVAYFAHAEELGDCWVAVRGVSIVFLKPAMTDVRATARFGRADAMRIKAQLEGRQKAEYTLDIELLDSDDDAIATAKGRYYLRTQAALRRK